LKVLKIITLLFLLFNLTACSWQEYFIIINDSSSNIIIEYDLLELTDEFPIFETVPQLCKKGKNNPVNWDYRLDVKDLNDSLNHVKIVLPPSTVLIFGRLSNDNYESFDQYFINSRVFNLNSIQITSENRSFEINKEEFDNFFTKDKG